MVQSAEPVIPLLAAVSVPWKSEARRVSVGVGSVSP